MERTRLKKIINKGLQIAFPLFLGAAILIWMYHGFNFSRVWEVLDGGMNYGWMLVSLVFGVFSHIFRGWRWKLTLAPLGEHPKTSDCVYAIFVSYAANLVVPRVGEISRCGVLAKYDGTSFSKSLGTVVTERLIDTLCVSLITGVTLIMQARVFDTFFKETGTDTTVLAQVFTSGHFYITIVCVLAVLVLAFFLIRNVTVFAKVKGILHNVWVGVLSLRHVKRMPLFILYTVGIWTCYFLQFYVSFFCFDFSDNLGVMAGLVMFAVGSIAVVVPTPNGAGPWHFAVITMMMLYGVGKEDAGIFALLVHGIQTFLLILLGIKPATPGMENRKKVILQAHMDMVPQKNNDTVHDFENDPIETYIDGDWVKAKGTTLGADDGMGVAAIMAIMEDKTLKHGPLEALITADEETGMFGAFGLKPGTVDGDILLNLDSEEEGELYIGCAGGEDLTAVLEYKEVETDPADIALKVTLKGLRGGHSGLEINEGRANANKLMARFMNQVITYDEACLVSWQGGNMRNAIPRECEVVITVPAEEEADVLEFVQECEALWNEEYHVHETPISFKAERVELPAMMVPDEIKDNLVDAIYACQNGVMRMIPTNLIKISGADDRDFVRAFLLILHFVTFLCPLLECLYRLFRQKNFGRQLACRRLQA